MSGGVFHHLSRHPAIIVTGPHRSGTTICAEMIGHDTGLPVYREEAFEYRNIRRAEELIRRGGVFQGPYLLPWLPVLASDGVMAVYMRRSAQDVAASVQRLRARGISAPYFDHEQAAVLWAQIMDLVPHKQMVEYESLRDHPLWVEDRQGWGHRQTC